MLLAHIRTLALFYLHRRHGWLTPASVYSQSALRCSLLISGHSSNKKSEASELVVLFYLHRRHGWFTPASVYSQSALRCFLLISGQWRYFTYIVDTAGLHQPPYIRNPHLRAPCSYPDIRQKENPWFTRV